jgi:hypothetical protein
MWVAVPSVQEASAEDPWARQALTENGCYVSTFIFWVRSATRLGIARTFALACVVEAIGVATSVLHTTAAAGLAAVLLGGTFMGLTALGLFSGRRLSTGDPRSALGVMSATFGLGQVVVPAFAGFFRDTMGPFVAASLVAGAARSVASRERPA